MTCRNSASYSNGISLVLSLTDYLIASAVLPSGASNIEDVFLSSTKLLDLIVFNFLGRLFSLGGAIVFLFFITCVFLRLTRSDAVFALC